MLWLLFIIVCVCVGVCGGEGGEGGSVHHFKKWVKPI